MNPALGRTLGDRALRDAYRRAWVNRGIKPEKIEILPRGLDTVLFDSGRRDPNFWQSRGVPAAGSFFIKGLFLQPVRARAEIVNTTTTLITLQVFT